MISGHKTCAEGMDADEWRDIFLIQWNPTEWTSLDSGHPRYNRQFQKSQLSFHLLQFLSNPWIVNTPLLCITDSFHGTNCTWTILTTIAFNLIILMGTQNLALFPGLPHLCSLVCIILSKKTKQKQGTTGNEATKLKCSNSERYFNWLTASRCPCSHSQAPTPTFCYL